MRLTKVLYVFAAAVTAVSAATVIYDRGGAEVGRITDDGSITNGAFEVGRLDRASGVVYDPAGGVMGYDLGGKILNAGFRVIGYYEGDDRVLDADRAVVAVLTDDGIIVNASGAEVGRWKGERDARAVAVFAFFFNRFF